MSSALPHSSYQAGHMHAGPEVPPCCHHDNSSTVVMKPVCEPELSYLCSALQCEGSPGSSWSFSFPGNSVMTIMSKIVQGCLLVWPAELIGSLSLARAAPAKGEAQCLINSRAWLPEELCTGFQPACFMWVQPCLPHRYFLGQCSPRQCLLLACPQIGIC